MNIVINCTRNYGLFSNLFEFFNICFSLEKNNIQGDKLVVNNFSKLYSTNNESIFLKYFDNKIDNSIILDNNIDFYNNTLDLGFDYLNVGTSDIYFNYDKRKYINKLINKYLHINESILILVNQFHDKYFLNKRVLGVHIRRTDHSAHGEIINLNDIIYSIKKRIDNYEQLYVMSDDINAINIVKDNFPEKLIYFDDVIRSDSNMSIHYNHNNDRNKIVIDVLKEAYILSMCDEIIITNSNVSLFVVCKNLNIKYNLIDMKYGN